MQKRRARWALFFGIGLVTCVLTAACTMAFAETRTVGILNSAKVLLPALEGFKAGMAQLGYVEGENVIYLFSKTIGSDLEALSREAARFKARRVDLVVVVGVLAVASVKDIFEGADFPVLFNNAVRPVEEGLVNSLAHPGGAITGVRIPETTRKTLEWLRIILPGAKKVFLPYNPQDAVSRMILSGMGNAPDQLGLTLVPYYTDSVEETVQAIRHLPPDMDAVLRIASPTLDDRNALLSRAAIERGIPMVSSVPLDAEVLLTVGGDLRGAGEQTARLAHLIFNGASPADLPVETAEALFTVNLKTAAKIGLTIPEEVLARVHHIFR